MPTHPFAPPPSIQTVAPRARARRQGVNGTQHDAEGNPVIDKKKFPDMAGLVKYGHSKHVRMGWYQNGCACGERAATLTPSWTNSRAFPSAVPRTHALRCQVNKAV